MQSSYNSPPPSVSLSLSLGCDNLFPFIPWEILSITSPMSTGGSPLQVTTGAGRWPKWVNTPVCYTEGLWPHLHSGKLFSWNTRCSCLAFYPKEQNFTSSGFMRVDELQPQRWEITAASSSTTSLIHISSWCVLEGIRNWNTACSVFLEARILDFSLNLPTFLRHNQGQRNINGLHTWLWPTACVPQASAGEPCSVLMAVLHFQKIPDCSLQTQGRNKRNLGRRCSTLPPFSWEEISLSC